MIICMISLAERWRKLLFKSFENHWCRPLKNWTLGINKRCSLSEMFRMFGLHSWEPCGCNG